MVEGTSAHSETFVTTGVVAHYNPEEGFGFLSLVDPRDETGQTAFELSFSPKDAHRFTGTLERPAFSPEQVQNYAKIERVLRSQNIRIPVIAVVARERGLKVVRWALLSAETGSAFEDFNWNGAWLQDLVNSGGLEGFIGGEVSIGEPRGRVEASGTLVNVQLDLTGLTVYLENSSVRERSGDMVGRPGVRPFRRELMRARRVFSAVDDGSLVIEMRTPVRWERFTFRPRPPDEEEVVIAESEVSPPAPAFEPFTAVGLVLRYKTASGGLALVERPEGELLEVTFGYAGCRVVRGTPDKPELTEDEASDTPLNEDRSLHIIILRVYPPNDKRRGAYAKTWGLPPWVEEVQRFEPFVATGVVKCYSTKNGSGIAVVERPGQPPLEVYFESKYCREVKGTAGNPRLTNQKVDEIPPTMGRGSLLSIRIWPPNNKHHLPWAEGWGVVPESDDSNFDPFETIGIVREYSDDTNTGWAEVERPGQPSLRVYIARPHLREVISTNDKPVLTTWKARIPPSTEGWRSHVILRVNPPNAKHKTAWADGWGVRPPSNEAERRDAEQFQPSMAVGTVIRYPSDSGWGVAQAQLLNGESLQVFFDKKSCRRVDGTPDRPELTTTRANDIPDTKGWRAQPLILEVEPDTARHPRRRAERWGIFPWRRWEQDLEEVNASQPSGMVLLVNAWVVTHDLERAEGFAQVDGHDIRVVFEHRRCVRVAGTLENPVLTIKPYTVEQQLPHKTWLLMEIVPSDRKPGYWYAKAWGVWPDTMRLPVQPMFGTVSKADPTGYGFASVALVGSQQQRVFLDFRRCYEAASPDAHPRILGDRGTMVPELVPGVSQVFMIVDVTRRDGPQASRAVAWCVLPEYGSMPEASVPGQSVVMEGLVRSFDTATWCGEVELLDMEDGPRVPFGLGQCRLLEGDGSHPELTRPVSLPTIPHPGAHLRLRLEAGPRVVAWARLPHRHLQG